MKYLVPILFFLLIPASAFAMVTPMWGPAANTYSAGTRYYPITIGSAAPANTTNTNSANPIPISGTISDLYVELTGAPGTGTSYTFTLMQNNAATAITCTIADTATSCSDTIDTVSVSPGDLFSWKEVGTGSPATVSQSVTALFTGTNSDESFISGGGKFFAFNPLNYYYLDGGNNASNESISESPFPTSGTIDDLYATVTSAPGTGNTHTFAIMQNGATTTISCSISGTNKACNDLTDSISVSPGDTLSIADATTGTIASGIAHWGFRFKPTVDGESVIIAQYYYFNHAYYASPYGILQNAAAQANAWMYAPIAFTLKKMYFSANVAPGSGKSFIQTYYDNTTATALACTVSDLATSCTDTSDSASYNQGDYISSLTSLVSSPSGASSNTAVTAVVYVAPGGGGGGDYGTPAGPASNTDSGPFRPMRLFEGFHLKIYSGHVTLNPAF